MKKCTSKTEAIEALMVVTMFLIALMVSYVNVNTGVAICLLSATFFGVRLFKEC